MKRSLKAVLIAASLAVTAQAAGAQTAPQPLTGCTVQSVNGTRVWVCPIGTFLIPAPAPTVAATAVPTVPPVGLNLLAGMVVPETAGSTFTIVTAMSVGIIDSAHVIVSRALKSDVQANVPNATGGTTSQTIVGVGIMNSGFIVAFSNANLATLQLDMPGGAPGQLFPTLRAVRAEYTTYVFQNGKWTAGSPQQLLRGPSISSMNVINLGSTMGPTRVGSLNVYQFG